MPVPNFSRREIRQLRRAAAQQDAANGTSRPSRRVPWFQSLRDAELTANLNPASNSKTGASTATAKFLVRDPDNAGDLKDGSSFTVTNRSLDASGLSGDYCIVARIGREWRLVWIDC